MTDKHFLDELFRQTDGNIETQISMYDVGAGIGLEKNEAGAIAQDLIIEDLAELRTLTGNISITSKGLKELGIIVPEIKVADDDTSSFDGEVVMSKNDNTAITTLLAEVKTFTASMQTDYPVLEEIILDIKTIELHMMSPHPKTAVIRELLRSLLTTLSSEEHNPIVEKIALMIQDKK